MLRAIIVDDEQAGIDTLNVLISRNAGAIRTVAATLNPEDAIGLIEDFQPDVVFLDVSMPILNGFELLNQLKYHDFKLVFTTAHRDYAFDAIRKRAFDYLLKPLDQDDFANCLRHLVAEAAKETPLTARKEAQVYLELAEKDGINYIRIEDIIRLEASRSYTVVHLEDGTRHVVSKSLKEFESKLDNTNFFRCHNSHMINLQKVKRFVNHQGYSALMKDGSVIDISKKCKDLFLERLKSL